MPLAIMESLVIRKGFGFLAHAVLLGESAYPLSLEQEIAMMGDRRSGTESQPNNLLTKEICGNSGVRLAAFSELSSPLGQETERMGLAAGLGSNSFPLLTCPLLSIIMRLHDVLVNMWHQNDTSMII